jgi:hypothetical protein
MEMARREDGCLQTTGATQRWSCACDQVPKAIKANLNSGVLILDLVGDTHNIYGHVSRTDMNKMDSGVKTRVSIEPPKGGRGMESMTSKASWGWNMG